MIANDETWVMQPWPTVPKVDAGNRHIPRESEPVTAGPSEVRRSEGTGTGGWRGGSYWPAVLWAALLIGAICFEGVGRKYLSAVPSIAFYFLKDVLLLVGLVCFGVRRDVLVAARRLYVGFGGLLVASAAWTVLQLANPSHESLALGLLGLRSYWLWWVAPLVVATALHKGEVARVVFVVLASVAVVVAITAFYQFQSPPDAEINRYALYRGAERTEVAYVSATGRPRVASTFAYLTGFTGFTTIAVPLLLSLGLGQPKGMLRVVCLAGAGAVAAVMPMGGSRAPVVLGLIAVLAVAWSVRAIGTPTGRKVTAALAVAVSAAVVAFPEATEGVRSRWEGEDTRQRFEWGLNVLPPVAMAVTDYPPLGIGTGMQHNARDALGVWPKYNYEGEYERLLVELGAPGFLLFWLARLGLAVAFVRAYRRLQRAGRLAAAGAALAWVPFTMIGSSLVFDHVWQALYFLGGGLILREVVKLDAERVPGPGAPMSVARPG